MSTTLEERGLRFDFDDNWWAIKWENHPACKAGLKAKKDSTHDVDFVATHNKAPYLIEVTDYTTELHKGRKLSTNGEVAKEIAEKVRDTIACLVWSYNRSELSTKEINGVVRSIVGWKDRFFVVVWIESKLDAEGRDKLQDLVKQELNWLKVSVLVTDIAAEQNAKNRLAGLKVTRLSTQHSS